MHATDLHSETLQQISALDAEGHQILSMYVDLDASRFPTPGAKETELRSLITQARAEAAEYGHPVTQEVDEAIEQIERLAGADRDVLRGAGGVGIFACAPAGLLEIVRLPDRVEPAVALGPTPWTEPLASARTNEGWGVAVVNRRSATIHRGGSRGLVQIADIEDDVHGRHAQGGWSQARFQRGIEQEVDWHLKRTADALAKAHRRKPFRNLAIIATAELAPKFQGQLPGDVAEIVRGVVNTDLEHAGSDRLLEALREVMKPVDRADEGRTLDRLEQELGTGGRAAAGLDEVIRVLGEGRVETLLLRENGGSGPAEDVQRAIQLAVGQSADVVVITEQPERLERHDSIAALLRW